MNATLLKEVSRVENRPDAIPAAVVSERMPDLTRFPNSDSGNAERFHAIHGADVRHVTESDQWLVWNGSRWAPDTTGVVIRSFTGVMRLTAQQSLAMADRTAATNMVKFALKSENRAEVMAGLAMAKTIEGVSVSVNDLDSDPWLIGSPNTALDLKQGRPVRPDRHHLITKSIGVSFDPNAECPTWVRFLETVTAGDHELIRFLQSAVGYTLTGRTTEQCLFFLHGSGMNGKGVFSETIKALVGDYGQTAPESLFTKDRNSSATNDVARLAGCRMAIASELDEGSSFAESKIKMLTGGDTITARFLHREFFDFAPTHKFWISGNHKPTVKGTDHGIWRRIRLLPFVVRIQEHERDPNLIDKLKLELPGILNWALAGCVQWMSEGLRTPTCVAAATADYRREEDVIGQFLTDCTTEDRDARTLTTSMFQAYDGWCDTEGIQSRYRLNARKLARKIEEHGFTRIKSHGVWQWESLALNSTS